MTKRGGLKELNTNLDIITQYIRDEKSLNGLSFAQKRQLVRWNFADNLIQAHPYWKDREIVEMIMKKFNISYFPAFYDLQNAKLLFGSRHIEHKPFWKQFLIEEAKKGMKRSMEREKPDLKAHYEYLKLIAGITGLYNDDPNQLTAELMKPADNYIVVNVDEKHVHFHLDDLSELNPDIVETIHQGAIKTLKMPEIEMDNGETDESSEG